MGNELLFQYCQKIVLFSEDQTEILLAKRQGEADYDGIYSFIGGKLETTDGGLLQGLRREKNEEIGEEAQLDVCPILSFNHYFVKKNGAHLILPHYVAIYRGGDIAINEEYSDYKWIKLADLAAFEPKIENIPEAVERAKYLLRIAKPSDFVRI